MRLKGLIFCTVSFLASLFLFQNCSGTKFTDELTMQDTAGNPAVEIKYCEYNGKTDYRPGAFIKTFVSSSVAYNAECVEQSHECKDGSFTGALGFPTCGKNVPQDCQIGTDVIPHGTRVERWEAASVPYTGTCRSEQRECTNGSIPGSYTVKTPCVKQPPPTATGKMECRMRTGQSNSKILDLYEKWSDDSYRLKETCSNWHSQRDNDSWNCGKRTNGIYGQFTTVDAEESCCPNGWTVVNGLCMPIANAGQACYGSLNCADGLECRSDDFGGSAGTPPYGRSCKLK